MKKKIVVVVGAAIAMCCLWGVFAFLLDSWTERGTFRKVVGLLALAGWVAFTYNVVTLKYRWIRKWAE